MVHCCCAGAVLPVDIQEGFTVQLAPPLSDSPRMQSDTLDALSDKPAALSVKPDALSGNPDLLSDSSDGFPVGAPSVLGRTYIAAHGSQRLVVGASKGPGNRLPSAPQVTIMSVVHELYTLIERPWYRLVVPLGCTAWWSALPMASINGMMSPPQVIIMSLVHEAYS